MKLRIRPAADRDLLDHITYIGTDNPRAAQRMVAATRKVFEQIACMPGAGSPRRVQNPRLDGLRFRPIPGFNKYLVFYLERENEVEIVRVLHGSRDVARILEEEPQTNNQWAVGISEEG